MTEVDGRREERLSLTGAALEDEWLREYKDVPAATAQAAMELAVRTAHLGRQ
jgi:hypothetical protein